MSWFEVTFILVYVKVNFNLWKKLHYFTFLSYFLLLQVFMKDLSKQDLLLTTCRLQIADWMREKNDVAWMKVLPFWSFLWHNGMWGMLLSYLALLSSHIVGSWNGQIWSCNDFWTVSYSRTWNFRLWKLSTLGHHGVWPCRLLLSRDQSAVWLQTFNTRAMLKHCW